MLRRSALKWWLLATAVVAIGFVAFCGWLFSGLATDDAKTSAIRETEQLLKAAGLHPKGVLPLNDISSYLWVDEECWSFLQGSMVKSSGMHTTTVTYYNQDEPNYNFRDVHEVLLQVDFAHTPGAYVRYYEGGIQGCSQMK
jgi:hypothetical protein